MRRNEVWWAAIPGNRKVCPVLLLSRNSSYKVRDYIIIAHITTRIRGIPAEVGLGKADGLNKRCVVNVDTISTIKRTLLLTKITYLKPDKIKAINKAIKFALDLE